MRAPSSLFVLPRIWLWLIISGIATVVTLADPNSTAPVQGSRSWPAMTREARPWTRWWWQGSAVEPAELTRQLTALRDAGIGGVEITPIYGVHGAEDQFIPYLSDRWVRMLEHTVSQADALDMGVDMATGTGWPFGGPWVDDNNASASLAHREWVLNGGERLNEPVRFQQSPLVRALGLRPIRITDLVEPIPANKDLQALALEQVKFPGDLPLISLIAYSEEGRVIDLTPRHPFLDWSAPPGKWTLYGLFAGSHGKLVERAAPGGEGYVIDHFSHDAIRSYLARFDRAFAGRRLAGLRAFFNDSYEVDDAAGEADWTGALLQEFEKRRGYDLRHYLPALFGRDSEDRNARVLTDYRETISDLLLETFTAEWTSWAHGRKQMVRNQAHGSPGSLLDLYATADIPETEGTEIGRFKWATSAAHVAGRRLASAEAATWLEEHFRSTLADVRAAVDRFFIAGVNHIVYHGTAYSPADEPWPGRLFYAAVEFAPQNAWWDDFHALNEYVARVQSFLQSGTPDHDVLLYFPLHDALAIREKGLLAHFGGANPPARDTAFETASETMQRVGFTHDYVSDRQVNRSRVSGGRLITEGNARYQTLVIPVSRFIPVETLERAIGLARDGATVVSFEGWSQDVPGLGNLEKRRARLRRAIGSVTFSGPDENGIREARVGRGRVLQGDDLPRLLARAGVARERMADQGMAFSRRADERGRIYFISNSRDAPVDGWVPLAVDAGRAVSVFDPISGRAGSAQARRSGSSSDIAEVRLQIPPGGSLIVTTSTQALPAKYETYRATGTPIGIGGPWHVQFVKGGPSLPSARSIDHLVSWTRFNGSDAVDLHRFSGTATYTTTFPRPAESGAAWQLDLGAVHQSARVRLNGRDVATLIAPPYQLVLKGEQFRDSNALEISVTNLSANRIAGLDRRGVPWKKFYNINYPARFPENRGPDGLFTATKWAPLESGLLGPVTLTRLGIE